jgi:4-amino-4-deoxy-L-arabinose transferase-like glycosyltransferase
MQTMRLSPKTWRWTAALLILASTAAHLVYVALRPIDLSPDEAQYWLWSRNLDWSYYSKGPLTAWLIRLSCELFGSLSQTWFGDESFAVRLPAVICGNLMLAAIYVLVWQIFRRDDWATWSLAAALTFPAVSMGQTLMTIDAPYTCCWAWALVLGHATLVEGRQRLWLPLGFVVGLGILAKYTMGLWLLSAGLYLAASPSRWQVLKQRGLWLMILVACVMNVPILWWNSQNGWVSFRHVGVQAGMEQSTGWNWQGPLVFLAGQLGMLLGVWFVLWLVAVWRYRPIFDQDVSRNYLWLFSVPQFVLFALFSLRTKVQLNWPITAYISGLVLALSLVHEMVTSAITPRWRRLTLGLAMSFIGSGLVTGVVHAAPTIRPWLAVLVNADRRPEELRIRRVDPSARLCGWSYLAQQIDAIRLSLRRQGIEPIVAASRWTTASELAFYCKGQPQVYSLGAALWDRQSQFDIWRPNPIADAPTFLGSTMIFVDVGRLPQNIVDAFEMVEPSRQIAFLDRGIPVAIWDVTICRGFRGFSKLPPPHY